MACLPLETPPFPELPFPLTLGAAIPSFDFDPALCCKLLPFPVSVPPVPLPPGTINPAIMAIIQANLQSMGAYFDALPFKCPRE